MDRDELIVKIKEDWKIKELDLDIQR